jgi:hypothetical protein
MTKLYPLHNILSTLFAAIVLSLTLLPAIALAQGTIFDDPLNPNSPANNPPSGGGAGGGTVFDNPLNPNSPANNPPGGGGGTNPSAGVGGGGTVAPAGTPLTGQQPDPQASPGNTQGSLETARELGGLNKLLYGFMVTIGGLFAWFGGLLLDTSLQFFVVEMGNRLANENFGFTVNAIWTIVRDLFNIIFIFALIFIGLKTILNSDDTSVKRDLGMLIVAALLINFSLLFTKMVVDFSNIAAIEIYNSFQVQGSGPTAALYQGFTNSNPSGGGGEIRSLSGVFMDHFNLPSYADTDTVRIAYDDSGLGGLFSWKVFSFGFLMMIMMIIAGFVFLAGAVLLIYRFVALVIYLMFSPVLFLGWIYPGFKGQSERYWRGFLRNAFVAPAYLFMLYICARLFEGMAGRTTMNFGNAFENAGSNFAVYAYFAVMIFFLIMATRVAGMMGAAGADVTARVGGYGVKMLRGVGGSVGGLTYRNTAGSYFAGALNRFDNANMNIARGDGRARDYTRAAVGGVVGGFNRAEGRRRFEAAANATPLGGKSLSSVKADAAYLEQTVKAKEQAIVTKKKEAEQALLDQKKETERNEQRAAITSFAELKDMSDAQKDSITNLTSALDNLSKEELGKLSIETFSDEKVAVHLTEKHIEKIKDSGKFTDAEMLTIRNARNNALVKIAEGTGIWATQKDDKGQLYAERILSRSKDEVAKLPDAFFTNKNAAQYLTPQIMRYKLEAGTNDTFNKASFNAVSKQLETLKVSATQDTSAISDDAKRKDAEADKRIARAKLKQWEKWSRDDNFGIRFGLEVPSIEKETGDKPSRKGNAQTAGMVDENALNEVIESSQYSNRTKQ